MADLTKVETKIGMVELGIALCSGIAFTDIFKNVINQFPHKDGLIHKIGRAGLYTGVFTIGCNLVNEPMRDIERYLIKPFLERKESEECEDDVEVTYTEEPEEEV